MKRILVSLCLAGVLCTEPVAAEPVSPAKASLVDYPGFERLTGEVADYRAHRLLALDEFNALARQGNTLILDARSPAAFAAGHIRGAVNLTFTDFTAASLARVIGDPGRRVLIYCN